MISNSELIKNISIDHNSYGFLVKSSNKECQKTLDFDVKDPFNDDENLLSNCNLLNKYNEVIDSFNKRLCKNYSLKQRIQLSYLKSKSGDFDKFIINPKTNSPFFKLTSCASPYCSDKYCFTQRLHKNKRYFESLYYFINGEFKENNENKSKEYFLIQDNNKGLVHISINPVPVKIYTREYVKTYNDKTRNFIKELNDFVFKNYNFNIKVLGTPDKVIIKKNWLIRHHFHLGFIFKDFSQKSAFQDLFYQHPIKRDAKGCKIFEFKLDEKTNKKIRVPVRDLNLENQGFIKVNELLKKHFGINKKMDADCMLILHGFKTQSKNKENKIGLGVKSMLKYFAVRKSGLFHYSKESINEEKFLIPEKFILDKKGELKINPYEKYNFYEFNKHYFFFDENIMSSENYFNINNKVKRTFRFNIPDSKDKEEKKLFKEFKKDFNKRENKIIGLGDEDAKASSLNLYYSEYYLEVLKENNILDSDVGWISLFSYEKLLDVDDPGLKVEDFLC